MYAGSERSRDTLARLSAILEDLNPIELTSSDSGLRKLSFSQFISKQGYRESLADLKAFKEDMKE